MQQIVDLHIHSRYSRACAKNLSLLEIGKTSEKKGIDIIATGDFTYPDWLKEIKNDLEEIDKNIGLYKLKKGEIKTKFILSSEVSLIYKENDKVRRVHLVVLAPNIKAVEELNNYLDQKYNIRSDGRPILGVRADKFVNLCLKINPYFLIFPAHIWTPWFSVFGYNSGFTSFDECFKEETKNIFAFETGLSSDPAMNWRVSALDSLTCLSNSDAHSLNSIGREANIFNLKEISYQEIYRIIKNRDLKCLLGSIEFYSELGRYYFDGHRDCHFSCSFKESQKLKNICPICQKPLTMGVLSQINKLADRNSNYIFKSAPLFYNLIELKKIIALALNIKNSEAKSVKKYYDYLINNYGPELDILLKLNLDVLKNKIDKRIVLTLIKYRKKKFKIIPGYDGLYGQVLLKD